MRRFCLFLLLISGILWPYVIHAEAPTGPYEPPQKVKSMAEETYRRFLQRKNEVAERKAKSCAETARHYANTEVGKRSSKEIPVKAKNAHLKEYVLVISSSVPISTLRTYVKQIANLEKKGIRVSVCMRGFVDGMKKIGPTIRFYLRMTKKRPEEPLSQDNLYPVDFYIDPIRTSKATEVPALIDASGRCVVYGDAPLDVLIRKLEEKKCGESFGATFEFAERDALAEIKKAALHSNWSRYEKYFRKHVEEEFANLPGAGALPKAKTYVKREIEPTYTLPFDVLDPKTGEVLYPKGFTYNPLKYAPPVPVQFVLIDGTDPKEIEFVKRGLKNKKITNTATICALGGSYKKLSKEFERPVFSGTELLDKHWCRATPCVITRKGDYLEVEEFPVR